MILKLNLNTESVANYDNQSQLVSIHSQAGLFAKLVGVIKYYALHAPVCREIGAVDPTRIARQEKCYHRRNFVRIARPPDPLDVRFSLLAEG